MKFCYFLLLFVIVKNVTKLDLKSERKEEYEIEFDIINRKKYIEYILRDDVEKRERLSDINEKIIFK